MHAIKLKVCLISMVLIGVFPFLRSVLADELTSGLIVSEIDDKSGTPEPEEEMTEPITGKLPFVALPDKEIRYFIRRGLDQTANKNISKIKVEIHEGKIKLYGTVASIRERNLAEEVIRSTPGVRLIQGRIKVAPASPERVHSASDFRSIATIVTDREIEKRCVRNLAKFNLNRTDELRIKVYLQVAVVSGAVENKKVRDLVIEHVRFTEGVRQVVDLLRIETKSHHR